MLDRDKRALDPGELVSVVAKNVRELRARRGISLSQLAQQAGIGKSTLSMLEQGRANPSIETLWAIGAALGVPFHELVVAPAPQVNVVRAGGGIRIDAESSTFHTRLLSSISRRGTIELYVFEGDPGRAHTSKSHIKGAREHIMVLKGRLRVGPVGGPIELGPGDLGWFAADRPHLYEALRKNSRALMIMDYE